MHFSCATAVLHSCCNLATVLATVSAGLGWTTGWIQTQLGETGRCKNDPLELISGAMQATEARALKRSFEAVYQQSNHFFIVIQF